MQPHRRYTGDVKAYHLYLQGLHHRYTTFDLPQALRLFERAVARDPGYALAHMGVGSSAMPLGIWSFLPPRAAFTKARAALGRALAIDDRLAEAHTYLGYLRFWVDWDWSGAEQAFQRALTLDPECVEGHASYGILLGALGRAEEAHDQMRRAVELDPLSPWAHATAGFASTMLGDFKEGRWEAQKAVELRPDFLLGQFTLGLALTRLGRPDEGIPVLEEAVRLGRGAVHVLCALGHALGLAGREERAEEVLRILGQRAEKEDVAPGWLALVFDALGREAECLECLERAFQERAPTLVGLASPGYLARFSSHPRVRELVRRVGLPA